MGEYTESLKNGGELKVWINNWYIQYYFPGPDRRYNGTLIKLKGSEIDSYIKAWENNYNDYLKLKESIPEKGTYEKLGRKGMMIRIGGPFDGVSLTSYHMTINDKEKIDSIVNEYKCCKEKVTEIQKIIIRNL